MEEKIFEKVIKETGADFDIPKEYLKEKPNEEIIYEWDEGEQNA